MSSWYELDIAVKILKNCDLTVMQCSSIYPCPPTKVGLNILGEMRERYGTRIGFSDHTDGFSASIASVVLGATVIEKHFSFQSLCMVVTPSTQWNQISSNNSVLKYIMFH